MNSVARSIACLLPFLLANSGEAAERLQLRGETMGTYYSIVIDSFSGSDEDARALNAQIEDRLGEITQQMSTWKSDSEISQFNAMKNTEWFSVSAEFAKVVQEAVRIHDLTDGAFDPTVSPLIDLWGFGDNRARQIPKPEEIEQALSVIGMQHLQVRMQPPALRKALPDVQLNLSAIAKGYGVDALADLLTAAGYPSFIVDVGGENRAGIAKSAGQPWKVGVESAIGGKLQRVVPLTDGAIATSGDYRNKFEVDGVVYSHTIDPVTGRPVEAPPASVSVQSETCMTADALATGLMVMGTERGMQFAHENNLSVMFQDVQANGKVTVRATGKFAQHAASAEVSAPENGREQANNAGSGAWVPFAAAATIFLIAAAGMSIGVILQNKSLKGSCGGLAAMSGEDDATSPCQLCSIPKDQCTNAELREKLQSAAQMNNSD